MTKGQRLMIEKIGALGTIHRKDLQDATRRALWGLGMIEPVERLGKFFQHGSIFSAGMDYDNTIYRLTALGQQTRKTQRF